LCFGGAVAVAVAVVVVVGVDWVVELVVLAAALWLEVDEEAPQALTTSMSRTAGNATRRSFMAVSQAPPGVVAYLEGRR
jgi:hypothetical protein